jgi:hypothetical protein
MPDLSNTTNDFQKSIARAILHEVKEEIEKAKEEVAAKASEEFQKRVKEVIRNAALDISNYYTIERVGQDILIRVKFEKEQK